MASIVNVMVAILGVWLVITPYLFESRAVALAIAMTAGAILAILGIASAKQKEYKPAMDYAACALGVALAVWGIVGWALGLGAGLNEIIVGAFAALLAALATRFTVTYDAASFYDRGGAPMVDVQSLRMKDNTILMKALLLQSMPSTVYVKPGEVWKVLTMIPSDLIRSLPGFLVAGYKECKAESAKKSDA